MKEQQPLVFLVQHTRYLIAGESAVLQKPYLLCVFGEIGSGGAKLLVPYR